MHRLWSFAGTFYTLVIALQVALVRKGRAVRMLSWIIGCTDMSRAARGNVEMFEKLLPDLFIKLAFVPM